MKVNIGRRTGKKFSHPLSKNVYTSSQYGFVQPSLCRECPAQDTIDLRVASKVFLQPLVKPTFGRMFLKQYHNFVPTADIYHPYESMLAGKPYNGSGTAHYIPSGVPTVSLGFLTLCCYMMSDFYYFECSDVTVSTNVGSVDSGRNLHIETPVESSTSYTKSTLLTVFQEIAANCGVTLPSTFWDCVFPLAVTSFKGASQPYGTGNTNLNLHVAQTQFNPEYFDWIVPNAAGTGIYCGRFTDRGRNFRKILLGLGYQLLLADQQVSILPLFAYYKTWFDLFAIQRDITWKDTRAFTIMEYIEQNNSSIYLLSASTTRQNIALAEFLFKDLPTCYYTQSADYAAAHISGTGIHAAAEIPLFNGVPGGNDGSAYSHANYDAQPALDIVDPAISQNQLDILKKLYQRVNIATAVGGKIAEFMRAVFGSDYKQDCESNFIGAQTTPIEISEVMSTAETSEGYLGEYAGRGIGFEVGNNHKFTARVHGYLISVFALVPDSRLCQAVDPNLLHVGKYDFFNPDFDAITLIPTPKLAIYGQYDVYPDGYANMTGGFGNIPNYTEYKVSFDTLNGDMSLRSTRSSYLPFTLGKYITPDIVNEYNTDEFDFTVPQVGTFAAGDIWRYIGLYRWLGNFDRVFINEGRKGVSTSTRYLDSVADRLDDNFVVYQYCDLKVSGYELPLADSFQTDSFGDHLKVDKA